MDVSTLLFLTFQFDSVSPLVCLSRKWTIDLARSFRVSLPLPSSLSLSLSPTISLILSPTSSPLPKSLSSINRFQQPDDDHEVSLAVAVDLHVMVVITTVKCLSGLLCKNRSLNGKLQEARRNAEWEKLRGRERKVVDLKHGGEKEIEVQVEWKWCSRKSGSFFWREIAFSPTEGEKVTGT